VAEKKEERAATTEEKTVEKPSLLEDIIQATKLKPSDETYSVTSNKDIARGHR